jgi:hypothetical protein
MRSLSALIVDNPPLHPHAGQRQPQEIRTGTIEGALVENSAHFCLAVAVRLWLHYDLWWFIGEILGYH